MIRDCSMKNTAEKSYPWVGILKSFGTVVLFTEPGIPDESVAQATAFGIVIKLVPIEVYGGGKALSKSSRQVGEVRNDWVIESFELYNDPVVICNS